MFRAKILATLLLLAMASVITRRFRQSSYDAQTFGDTEYASTYTNL